MFLRQIEILQRCNTQTPLFPFTDALREAEGAGWNCVAQRQPL
jgi:hypothetical protein